jgi:hypothetical protein
MVEAAERNPYALGGFRIYDVSQRSNPKLIAFQKTGGIGVHRFDMDKRYAYISTEMEGYVGNILVIYDTAIRRSSRRCRAGGCRGSMSPQVKNLPGRGSATGCTAISASRGIPDQATRKAKGRLTQQALHSLTKRRKTAGNGRRRVILQ